MIPAARQSAQGRAGNAARPDFLEITMTVMSMNRWFTAALAALALCIAAPGQTQAQSPAAGAAPLLKASQVTEDALVSALEIDAPMADTGGAATRSIRPSMRATATAPKPAGPGRASLLITFATGSAELTPETLQVLGTVAKALQSDRLAGFAFKVEGHADPRGTPDYNLKLSAERAQSVVGYLTGRLGVLPERLQAVGKGDTELLNTERPDAQENRRVTIVTTR